jgi:hypothetical protein
MSVDNPLWGAPRVHGELLKLGIEVSQATVGRYLPRRPKAPSPTWRIFLQNHMTVIVAVDMFVVATATFRLLYAVIILDHASKASRPFRGHPKPDASLDRAANHRSLSLGQSLIYPKSFIGQPFTEQLERPIFGGVFLR